MTRIATQLAALSLVALSACTTSEMGFTHYSDGTPVEPEATESSETLDIPGQPAELADELSAAPLAACSIEGERLSVVDSRMRDMRPLLDRIYGVGADAPGIERPGGL